MAKKGNDKQVGVKVGVFLLVAYTMLVAEMTDSNLIVFLVDVVSGLAVIGIARLLAPYFGKVNKEVTWVYVGLKSLEGGLMLLGGVAYASGVYGGLRNWIYEVPHLWTFILSGFLFYWLLYKSKLVPRWLSVWGGVAIMALLVNTVTKLVGMEIVWLEYLLILIITNEVVLAVWLMTKGLKAVQ